MAERDVTSLWCKREAVTGSSRHEPRIRTCLTTILFKKNGRRVVVWQLHGSWEQQDASCSHHPDDLHYSSYDQRNNSVIGVPTHAWFCGMYSNPRPSGSSWRTVV